MSDKKNLIFTVAVLLIAVAAGFTIRYYVNKPEAQPSQPKVEAAKPDDSGMTELEKQGMKSLPPQASIIAYDHFSNIFNIMKDKELVQGASGGPGWTRLTFQPGLEVHSYMVPTAEMDKKGSYLRSSVAPYHQGSPGCFVWPSSLNDALKQGNPKGISDYSDLGLQKTALDIINKDLKPDLAKFFGSDEKVGAFLKLLADKLEQGTMYPLHIRQICPSGEGYLLDTISSKDKIFRTEPTTVLIRKWSGQGTELTDYPPIKVSGPTFWYYFVPGFFKDGHLLFTEDAGFPQATGNSLNRWQAYRLGDDMKVEFIEDCMGNNLRDQDRSGTKEGMSIISETGYQYACKPEYIKQ
jgi:hypothetical protein